MDNNQSPTIIQATAIPVQPQAQVVHTRSEPPPKMSIAFSYSRTVRLFAFIEAFFLILYSFYQPYFLIQSLGPLCGYFGAKKFNKPLTYAYITYLILSLSLKIINLSLTFYNYDQYYIFLGFLSIFIDFWILKITSSFMRSLNALTDDQRDNLRHMRLITTYHYW